MHETEWPTGDSTATSSRRFLSFGTGLLALAVVAVISGLALLPFYSATAGGAYHSLEVIQRSAPLRILRAAHHWASALLILLGAVYLVYGLFSAAYRDPLRLAWAAVVLLVLSFLAFQLTGHLLPWDAQAVSTAAIETGIAENVPVVGHAQARLLRGGNDAVSPQTLTAWYITHVALLPALLACLAALYLLQWRRLGTRWVLPRAPLAAVLLILLLAAVGVPARLGAPASPADYRSFTAPPEWYVLPLHTLLDLAQRIRPSLGFVGSMVVPGLAVLWLLALPWLDRRKLGQSPSVPVRSAAVLGVAGVVALTLASAKNMEPLFGPERAPAEATIDAAPASKTPLDPALIKKGQALFQQNGCAGCHKVGGQGGAVGPPLDGESTRHPDLNWQVSHLKDPSGVTRGSTMPAYKQLSDSDLRALATFLLSLK